LEGWELHEIAPERVEEELVEAGFELLHRGDSFIEKASSSLVAARRRPLGEGKRSGPRSLFSTPIRVVCYPVCSSFHFADFDFGTELEGFLPL